MQKIDRSFFAVRKPKCNLVKSLNNNHKMHYESMTNLNQRKVILINKLFLIVLFDISQCVIRLFFDVSVSFKSMWVVGNIDLLSGGSGE